MRIVAIDPGMASCGMVTMSHEKGLESYSVILTKADNHSKSNEDALRRAREITAHIIRFIDQGNEPDALVIEEFTDQACTKGRAGIWTTPMAIGYIYSNLSQMYSVPIYWQNPSKLGPKINRDRKLMELANYYRLDKINAMPKTKREHIQSALIHGHEWLKDHKVPTTQKEARVRVRR